MPPTRSLERIKFDDLIRFNRDSRGDSSLDAVKFLERCRDGPKTTKSQPEEVSQRSHSNERERKRSIRDTLAGNILWHNLHCLNNISIASDQDHLDKDCSLGNFEQVKWAEIIPYSEEWIIGLMLWLRECGAIRSQYGIERGYLKNVPTLEWMGDTMEYQIGGLLFMPTKKCLYRLCLLAQVNLFDNSEKHSGDFRSTFTPTDLTWRWSTYIGKLGVDVRRDGKTHRLGTKYPTVFEDGDYHHHHLHTSVSGRTGILNIVSVYLTPRLLTMLIASLFAVRVSLRSH